MVHWADVESVAWVMSAPVSGVGQGPEVRSLVSGFQSSQPVRAGQRAVPSGSGEPCATSSCLAEKSWIVADDVGVEHAGRMETH